MLRGRGVPGAARHGRGDLVVGVVVETPTRLDERQEELLRELAALRDEESPDGQIARAAASRCSAGSATPSTRAERVAPVFLRPVAGRRRPPATLVEVAGDEAHHAVVVRGLRVGEQVALTDGAGTTATVHGHRDRRKRR